MKEIACLSGCILMLFASCSKNPVADFSFSTPLKVGEDITFTNQSENADEFLWNFGDGYTSRTRDPLHAFGTPGMHTVSLQAIGEKGSVYASKELLVTGITYSFLNKTYYDIPSFFSFYWDGTGMQDLVDHGTLDMDKETLTIITERNSISFGLVIGETIYVSEAFPLTDGKHNQIVIGGLILNKGAKGATAEDAIRLSAFRAAIK